MKTHLLTIGFALGAILTSFAQAQVIPLAIDPAQVIPLTIDPTQSSVNVDFAGAASSSPLSGSVTLELTSSDPENAQITALNLVLDDGLNFNLFSGFAAASTLPGDVTISLATAGAAGPVSGDPFTGMAFTQLANSLTLDGDVNIVDSLGFAGGTQAFDLSQINVTPVDFNSVNFTRFGDLITISSSFTITENINPGAGNLPLVFEVNYVASGIVPPPVLLGDVNLDGTVDYGDIMPFIWVLFRGRYQTEADCNQNDRVNFLDISPFITQLNANADTN